MDKSNFSERIKYVNGILNLLDGEIEGRKKFQKIVYLFSELSDLPIDYNFKWNLYGVYSNTLALDIEYANRLNHINESVKDYKYYTNYKYELSEKGKETTYKVDARDNLITIAKNKNAQFLEVLSSIVYFSKDFDTKDEINTELMKYKGHLREYFSSAYTSFEELTGKQLA